MGCIIQDFFVFLRQKFLLLGICLSLQNEVYVLANFKQLRYTSTISDIKVNMTPCNLTC